MSRGMSPDRLLGGLVPESSGPPKDLGLGGKKQEKELVEAKRAADILKAERRDVQRENAIKRLEAVGWTVRDDLSKIPFDWDGKSVSHILAPGTRVKIAEVANFKPPLIAMAWAREGEIFPALPEELWISGERRVGVSVENSVEYEVLEVRAGVLAWDKKVDNWS